MWSKFFFSLPVYSLILLTLARSKPAHKHSGIEKVTDKPLTQKNNHLTLCNNIATTILAPERTP